MTNGNTMNASQIMYTCEALSKIRQEAKRMNLAAPYLFWIAKLSHLQKICNGCGPESMEQWGRDVLTWVFRNYAAAHCIHDCDFELSDGDANSFDAANDAFYWNMLRMWEDRYGWSRWINPVALWDRNKIRLAYKAVSVFGFTEWVNACKRSPFTEGVESDVNS